MRKEFCGGPMWIDLELKLHRSDGRNASKLAIKLKDVIEIAEADASSQLCLVIY